MKIKSIKYNIFMNFMRMLFGVLSPLVVMPYINRKFGPSIIGEVEYLTTLISYFVLFAGLGVSTYGIREVAKIRDDFYKRSKFTFEMLVILFLTNIISYLLLILVIYLNIFTNINLIMLYLISLNIFFTSFSFEWFYQGIEDQEYITKRSILIKIFSIILIFTTVKDQKDILKYLLILQGGLFFSSFVNIINLRKHIIINKSIVKNLEIKKHFKSLCLMFTSSIAMLIYSQIDIIMIGNISGTRNVALYNISVKILNLGKIVITVIGATLLPRLTSLYFSNSSVKYELYLKKTLHGLILYSFYMFLLIYINAFEIIYLFGGEYFHEAILTLKFQSIIILLSGLAYFYGVIVLYSQKKDKPFLYSVIPAALINIVLNYILIPKYNQNGAVFSTLIAESTVILLIFILGAKELKKINFININTIKIFVVGISFLIAEKYLVLNFFMEENLIIKILMKNILIFSLYTIILFLLKEEFLLELLIIIKSKLKKLYCKET